MPEKKKKMRGSRTHGYGSKKKHRGGGSRGGRGYGGSHKHKWSRIVSKDKDHYGSKGFVQPRRHENIIINIDELPDSREIDLTGKYDKLLGRGSIDRPVTVRVREASASAAGKIEAAGGEVVLSRKPETGEAEQEAKQPTAPEKEQEPAEADEGEEAEKNRGVV